jgi:hypothetical protein
VQQRLEITADRCGLSTRHQIALRDFDSSTSTT